MNKLFLSFMCMALVIGQGKYYGSTTAPVTLAGAIIKSQHSEIVKKYNRKDCPVCKGKGWFMSGDGILKIECTYCEPNKELLQSIKPNTAPIDCDNGQCSPKTIRRSYGTR